MYMCNLCVYTRFIELNSFGLVDHWIKSIQANPRHCLNAVTQKRSENPRLFLTNLTGAFVVLAIGYVLSFLVFCGECLMQVNFRSFCFRKPQVRLQETT